MRVKVRRWRKRGEIQDRQKGRCLFIPQSARLSLKLRCCAERWFKNTFSTAWRGLGHSLSLKDTLSGAQVLSNDISQVLWHQITT